MIISKKYKRLLDLNLENFEPWRILSKSQSDKYGKDLRKRYSKRNLIPFARRIDCDDVACWDLSKTESIEKIYIIHDFASEGWEQQEEFENFDDWFKEALNDMFSFEDE
ncbi:hypothetical protein NBT05_17240 [Aquimarina sp. ERC-38]|uniref:SMI1/KNR4 family protein n=1 Tax=Aquimarina sp. ERC-38 TaxID=2949996 RepID=UPI0022461230|nr:SMI1/KNR4 family protein [Aquimarina sp. ERC-38]UZO80659.1 hypothetical protein NBT05_17170 [Aquimarina sp. ERC-38]UZO80673.1 hypothetical protein NBT05_17240 [Aquimarina sp. ERC-38]